MKIRTSHYFAAAALLGFSMGVLRSQERFDYQVRNDIFAGFAGDKEAMERGLKKLDETLAANPKHAEALVWRGSALFFQSGQLLQAGDFEKGMPLYQRGLAEMDEAGKLAPENIGVLAPRGAVMLTAGINSRGNPQAKMLIEKGVADYEKILALQVTYWDRIGTHPKGELLQGLANGYRVLGNKEKADGFFERIQKEVPDSPYAKRAAMYFEKGTLTPAQTGCIGCHTNSSK